MLINMRTMLALIYRHKAKRFLTMKKYKKGQRLTPRDVANIRRDFSRLVGKPTISAADFATGEFKAAQEKIRLERVREKAGNGYLKK